MNLTMKGILSALFILLLSVGCSGQSSYLARGWTPPVKVADSEEGLSGGLFQHKWHGTIIAWQSLRDGSARCFLLNRNNNTWSERRVEGLPPETASYPAIDQASDIVLFHQGYF